MIRQKTWLLWETHFPFIMVYSKMTLHRLDQSKGDYFGRLLKSQYELLPFDALYNLIGKMHNTSKFW